MWHLLDVIFGPTLDDVDGDKGVVVSSDFSASVDGRLNVCVVDSPTIHENVAFEVSERKSGRNRGRGDDSHVEIFKSGVIIGHCYLLSSVGVYSRYSHFPLEAIWVGCKDLLERLDPWPCVIERRCKEQGGKEAKGSVVVNVAGL